MTERVLLVENHRDLREILSEQLGQDYEVTAVGTLAEVAQVFSKHKKITAFVDGCLEGHEPDMPEVIRRARKDGWVGLGVAISHTHRAELIAAGCDTECEKHRIARFLQNRARSR